MNNDMYDKFQKRMEDKKAAAPKLHRFEAEFRIGILAVDDEKAAETVEIISKHLVKFDDIESAEGELK
jgi:hypothetical protein